MSPFTTKANQWALLGIMPKEFCPRCSLEAVKKEAAEDVQLPYRLERTKSRAQPAAWNAQMSEFVPDGVDDPRPQSPGGRQISNSGSLGTSPIIHNLRLMFLSQKSNHPENKKY
ncbi:hypothetical protein H0G86_011403 [Trichoderma simmonsii]|uniref:Uncharacterized protein n=1 Tax=Trichoderma simmonsii TaxID=1491479 RepID=A0A8G0LLI4_9HYPO|nr:hypothetical protein H0G86_011403 [Trichoderma simmonsii]